MYKRQEQELADATFEDEDIDEEELRDISGRAAWNTRHLPVFSGFLGMLRTVRPVHPHIKYGWAKPAAVSYTHLKSEVNTS